MHWAEAKCGKARKKVIRWGEERKNYGRWGGERRICEERAPAGTARAQRARGFRGAGRGSGPAIGNRHGCSHRTSLHGCDAARGHVARARGPLRTRASHQLQASRAEGTARTLHVAARLRRSAGPRGSGPRPPCAPEPVTNGGLAECGGIRPVTAVSCGPSSASFS